MNAEAVVLVAALGLAVFLVLGPLRGAARRYRDSRLVERLAPPTELERELPRTGALEARLRSAGLEVSSALFVLLLVLLAVAVFFLSWWLLSFLAVALLAGVLAALLAFATVVEVGRRRLRHFETALVDAIDLMVAALAGGENPPQAIATVAEMSTGVIRREFGEISRRLQLGLPIEQALGRILHHYDTEGTRLFAYTLIAKWRVGGDLAPVLRSVNRILRDRLRLRLHLDSQLAGARLSSILVALLPYLLLPVFAIWRPAWLALLTAHPLGPPLLAAAVFLQILGFLWLQSLLAREV